MAAANAATRIREELGSAAVARSITYHPKFSAETPRSSIRQDVAMPALATMFDWSDRASRPELIYIHVQLLLASLVDPLFDAMLRKAASTLVSGCDGEVGAATAVIYSAAPKTFGRMESNMNSSPTSSADSRFHSANARWVATAFGLPDNSDLPTIKRRMGKSQVIFL
jgi:hypothetical protein